MPSYNTLKHLSFAHSAVYALLLFAWLVPGLAGLEFVFGLSHGLGWILMCLLAIVAERRGTIPLWLAVMVSIVGSVGPFAGSLGFVWHERARARH